MKERRIATVGPIGIAHELKTALAGSSIGRTIADSEAQHPSVWDDFRWLSLLVPEASRDGAYVDKASRLTSSVQLPMARINLVPLRQFVLGTGQMLGHLDPSALNDRICDIGPVPKMTCPQNDFVAKVPKKAGTAS